MWSLILREEHRLRAFQNRMQGRLFGQKRDEVMGVCRNPHNVKLCDIVLFTKYN
jgi:hypothetical protein